ncbi:hypothetical protein WDU94_000331, partial [Cyamophila willieti]
KYQDKHSLSRTRPTTSTTPKYVFLHNELGVDETFEDKIKILNELQINTNTLKCHNFSMDDLLLLKKLRQYKRENKPLTIFENQILKFFDRPELSATRHTVSTPYKFHLTDDDDEYIDETTTSHVNTEERNERFDIEQQEINPGAYEVDHTTLKLKREAYIELLRMKLNKEGKRQDTSLEKSLINKFNNRLRRSIVNEKRAENMTRTPDGSSTNMSSRQESYDEIRKRNISSQIIQEQNRDHFRKQCSGGIIKVNNQQNDKTNKVEESSIDGTKKNIRSKRNIKNHQIYRINSSETFQHKAKQIKDKFKSIQQKRHTYPRDESFQNEDLFKSFELITPRRKHNQSVDYKWSISEPNNESFEYYSKSESVKGSDYPEPEESANSVLSDPFGVFRQTFPSGSVMDPREFSTPGTTSGIEWKNKPFDNFGEYDISKKIVKTKRPFDIHYFDEEIAREDELIKKGLLRTTTYKTPELVDKNEMYSFSDDKSKELCRVWVTSNVVSNIMEKYKLTSTRSVKELLRYTYFYRMWKMNQTKSSTSTTKFNEWAVYRHKRALAENDIPEHEDNQAEERKSWEETKIKDINRINIMFDPNQSFEEIDPRFFTKKSGNVDTSTKQTYRPRSTFPNNYVKHKNIYRLIRTTLSPQDLNREVVIAIKNDKDFYEKNTTRYVRKNRYDFRRGEQKRNEIENVDKNRCLVLPRKTKVIETDKKWRLFNDFIITSAKVRRRRTKSIKLNRDPVRDNEIDIHEIPTRPIDKDFADQLHQHKWNFNQDKITKKFSALKDIILNKTEDNILYKGWLEYKKIMMDTHERYKRDLNGSDETLYKTPRPKKNHDMSFAGKSTRHYKSFIQIFTQFTQIKQKYHELKKETDIYNKTNTDYEEYRKRFDAKKVERYVYKPTDPLMFERYIQRCVPKDNARTLVGQLLFNENIRRDPETTTAFLWRRKERHLKILTQCAPEYNRYYTDKNIYNESEWIRYAVTLDDSRINDKFVEEELERKPTLSPFLITQVYVVKNMRQKRDLKEIKGKYIENQQDRYIKKHKREADHNWSIFERTAPSDPPDDNFDWKTITPFPTQKPKRPGRTPYADSAICNDPDSADTEENRRKFETEMRDFFGSDIETMTEIAKEREKIRENFIKKLEEKEKKEKEAKVKDKRNKHDTVHVKQKRDLESNGGVFGEDEIEKIKKEELKKFREQNIKELLRQNINNQDEMGNRKKRKRDLEKKQEDLGEKEIHTLQEKRNSMIIQDEIRNHKRKKREADHNWSIFERTAPTDPPDDNFDWKTITPFPTEKPKRPGRTPYTDSAICNDPDSADTEENRQKFETEMRDFFGSDIETMTEIAKEREKIRENFIKKLEEREKKEKELTEKNNGHDTNHKKHKREADHNWSIFERTAPSDPPDDNFDWKTITPFPTQKPKRPGRTPYADSAICNDPDSADTEENRQKFETEMRDFFGSDIETMTEIAKEREKIRENFIKKLEEKEKKENEAKEKNEEHLKKTTIRHMYSGGIISNVLDNENKPELEDKRGAGNNIKENHEKMRRDSMDKQRLREIYGEYDYVETSTIPTQKKGMLTKDPLEHGQYLNFYQHLMKYNQSLFGKNNNMKENRAQKRHRRNADTEPTTNDIGTTEEYLGRYIRKHKVNQISEALHAIRMEYNLTFLP